MDTPFKQLKNFRILPIVTIDNAADALPLAEAVLAAGLPCIEITFRTAAASQAIETIARRGDMLVGAGTVLNEENARAAVDSGARFIVTPGVNPKIVEFCLLCGLPIAPGICTPTDIEMALNLGCTVLKFFPAEAMGGEKTLKAIAAPYAMVEFIPTGGINVSNIRHYLGCAQVLCCGGSWMVEKELIRTGRFDRITELTKEALAAAGRAPSLTGS
jgi:2-dehydro-3-deoxyphosphogluconate aldolase/(4S)-4-hydroxy-2-oxoglutarate aldolase